MYVTPLKTTLVDAWRAVFDADFPHSDKEDFSSLHVSIEYPQEKQDYPSVWVDYADTADLVRAGVGHVEYTDPVTGDLRLPFTRWRYTGVVTFTIVALTSLERDRLYDQMVGVISFGSENALLGQFRAFVEANPYVTVDLDYDTVSPGGEAATPGTPWKTDEIIYEKTISMHVIGEYYPAMTDGVPVLLSRIQVDPPQIAQSGAELPLIGSPGGDSAEDWH